MRRVKIVCTIGPASESVELLRLLVEAGMDVARLNLSHGDQAWHGGLVARIRQVAADGTVVTLADGTRWQPRPEQQAVASRWQSGDDVLVCSGRLVNARTGEMAGAAQF